MPRTIRRVTHQWMPVTPPSFTDPSSIVGLVAWYDASNAASITASGSPAHVSQWNDLSGNGYHLTQGSGANQPATGVATQNGLNRFDFDGSDVLMSVSTPTTPTPCTVVLVWALTALPAFYRPYDGGSAGNRPLLYANAGDTAYVMQAATAADTGRAITGGVALIHFNVFNGASSEFWENGTQYGGALSTGSGAFAGLSIGSDSGLTSAFTGAMFEFLVYSHALTSTERTNLNDYLRTKWAVY